MRIITTLALAAAMVVTGVVASAPVAEAGKKYTKKACMATTRDGAKVSFICKIDEKCCWDVTFKRSMCVGKDRICL